MSALLVNANGVDLNSIVGASLGASLVDCLNQALPFSIAGFDSS